MATVWSNSLNELAGQGRLTPSAAFDGDDQDPPCCAVCLDDIRGGDSCRQLPACGHRYHSECIDSWLRSAHPTCPLCRAQVPQIITVNQLPWSGLLWGIWSMVQDFLQKVCSPELNQDLTSMLCGNR